MKSPKGKYRLKEVFIVGVIALMIVTVSGGFDMYGVFHFDKMLSPNGWIFKQFNNISEICVGLLALYMGHRLINHTRTHNIIKESKDSELIITSVWIIAIAIVVGCAII